MLAGLIAGCAIGVATLCPGVAQAYQADVTVSATATTGPLPSGFVGLALEYNTIPKWVGNGTQPVDPVLLQLIRNLAPTGRPVIRFGGESTDRSWWPAPGLTAPLGVTYPLGPAWARSAHAFAAALNANILLGINLEANRTQVSQVMADQLVSGIGSRYIGDLEVGNEPDLYPFIPWYKLVNGKAQPWYIRAGTAVFSRPITYGPQQFTDELERTIKVLPHLPIAGPDASTTDWMDSFSHLLHRNSPVRMLTSHAYGVNQCIQNPHSTQYPSVPNLLRLTASRNLLNRTASYIAVAHRFGAAYRVDEMGSVTCNGRLGVSNTMASALWAIDSLFAIARQSVNGVNLHTYPNSDNGLFDISQTQGSWSASVHPLYYGALMFSLAAPAGSHLIQVLAPTNNGLRAWATDGADRAVRVMVINDNLTSGALANVNPPAGYDSHPGALERLRAPSAYATGDVTLGGRSFGTATSTGLLSAPVHQTVKPRAGTYSIYLPPASAALLTLSPRR